MMKLARSVMLIVLAATLWACGGNKTEKAPEGVLGKDKMVAVMTDIMLAEAKASGAVGQRDSIFKQAEQYYAQIGREHGVTEEAISTSLEWYTTHPEQFDEVLRVVNDSLMARRATY